MSELREKLAELCHEQWALWVDEAWGMSARDMRSVVMKTTIPYAELGNQELFREWADKVLGLVRGEDTPWMERGVEDDVVEDEQPQGWISVEDRLPKAYELVWAIWDREVALMKRRPSGQWSTETMLTDGDSVTHWLPLGLPDVPKPAS